MLRKITRSLGIIILTVLILFGLFLAYASVTYYNPKPEMVVWQSDKPDTIPCDSTFNILTWNIGYAGLGDDMDFFYDSGTKVRDTKERTLQNLDSISTFLGHQKQNEFFLIQEVDLNSHRSYNIYEMENISNAVEYQSSVGINYDVSFVPIPVSNPMGSVKSGVATFSKPTPSVSTRYSYPGQFPWPNRLFNLRRCMLVNRYPTSDGKEFVLVNSHKSAFDNGSLKQQEMAFLKTFILKEYLKGNYILVGGDWNQSPPNFPLNTFGDNYDVPFFKLTNIDNNFMPATWTWAFDPTYPTNRYLNEPYTPNKNYTGILDFFLVSPNIQVIETKTHQLQFKNSDHNPVSLTFKLISQVSNLQ